LYLNCKRNVEIGEGLEGGGYGRGWEGEGVGGGYRIDGARLKNMDFL